MWIFIFRTAILETVLPVHVQKYLDMYESVELNEQQVELSTPFATAEGELKLHKQWNSAFTQWLVIMMSKV